MNDVDDSSVRRDFELFLHRIFCDGFRGKSRLRDSHGFYNSA